MYQDVFSQLLVAYIVAVAVQCNNNAVSSISDSLFACIFNFLLVTHVETLFYIYTEQFILTSFFLIAFFFLIFLLLYKQSTNTFQYFQFIKMLQIKEEIGIVTLCLQVKGSTNDDMFMVMVLCVICIIIFQASMYKYCTIFCNYTQYGKQHFLEGAIYLVRDHDYYFYCKCINNLVVDIYVYVFELKHIYILLLLLSVVVVVQEQVLKKASTDQL
eukprot:TRINITY_DN12974_c0_g2_i1.p1 TRINITY_DN12974_c0_g2~~TRINITY_DN12974_c0_g2_i1.p1  ORF type:complete len:215 (+),score=-12.19 TRINITY_DN12974_c0_g2_i1:278-922(+)